MDPPRSVYKTDFVSYDWAQNNLAFMEDAFCTDHNIDSCLQYISQELCALGYPSINPNVNSYTVNCDIVTLLNVTYELLSNSRDHSLVKEDLENRNQRLFSDLNALNKKNSQLKNNLEQLDRRYKDSLEKERQLNEKNSQLQQLIKAEKDETKKLSSQLQQQKVAHQHAIRKLEYNMNQMKGRMNQILNDKTSVKKIANISPSNLLQRNSKQRGKWQNGSVVKSSLEDMYSSLIGGYEQRCLNMLQEISEYQKCLELIQSEIVNVAQYHQDPNEEQSILPELSSLQTIWDSPNLLGQLNERFRCLLERLKVAVKRRIDDLISKKAENVSPASEITVLSDQLKSTTINENDRQVTLEIDSKLIAAQKELELERDKISKKELELAATLKHIQKEKAELEFQRMEFIKMNMQSSGKSKWHQSVSPSFCVVTTKEGLTAVPSAKELIKCIGEPDQKLENLGALWKMKNLVTQDPKSSRHLEKAPSPRLGSVSPALEIGSKDPSPSNELPNWAAVAIASSSGSSSPRLLTPENKSELSICISNEDFEPDSTAEEESLSRLKAAMDEMEVRRKNLSS